jgi:hypothetical protein
MGAESSEQPLKDIKEEDIDDNDGKQTTASAASGPLDRISLRYLTDVVLPSLLCSSPGKGRKDKSSSG